MKHALALGPMTLCGLAAACQCGAPAEEPDQSRACTSANHCQMIDGEAQCDQGYDWLDPDGASGDYRCVPIPDASAPVDAAAADAASPVDAGARDVSVQDLATADSSPVDAGQPDLGADDAAGAPDSLASDHGGQQQDAAPRPDSGGADTGGGRDVGGLPDAGPPPPCEVPAIGYSFDPATDCEHTYTGAIIISSNQDEDWPLLDGVDCIVGGLVVENTSLAEVVLPVLEYVSQNILIWSHGQATRIALPALRRVGGELSLATSAASEISLPLLEEVGADLTIARMDALASLALPALRRVGGSIELGDVYSEPLGSLAQVSLPELLVVEGNRFMVGSEVPVSLHAPRLVRSGQLGGFGGLELVASIGDAFVCASSCSGSFEGCLAQCGGPVAIELGALCSVNGFRLYYPQHVDLSIDLGALKATDSLTVQTLQDGRLSSLDLGQLQQAGSVRLTHTGFATIDMPALVAVEELHHELVAPRLPFAQACPDGCPAPLRAPALAAAQTVELVCADCPVDLSGLRRVTGSLHVKGNPVLALDSIADVSTALLTSAGQRVVSAVVQAVIGHLEVESPVEASIAIDGVVSLQRLTLSRISGAEPAVMTQFTAPDLATADTIYLDFTEVVAFAAPALTAVRRFENNGSPFLETVDLGTLSHLDELEWRNSYGGVDVAFPSIQTLGRLSVMTSDSVPQLPSLTWADAVFVGLDRVVLVLPAPAIGELSLTRDNGIWFSAPNLQTLDELDLHSAEPAGPLDLSAALPALTEITGSLQMDSAWYATTLVLPHLQTIGGASYIRFNSRLESISLPDLTTAFAITIEDNSVLSSVSLPQLASVSWLTVRDNPSLPQCDLIAQAQSLFTPPPPSGRYCIELNGDDCPDDCP